MSVTDDAETAFELVASGADVVLLVPQGSDPGRFPEGPGRLAVMVGDPADPATLTAARAMHAELFRVQD